MRHVPCAARGSPHPEGSVRACGKDGRAVLRGAGALARGSIHWIAPVGRTCYDRSGRPVRMAGVVGDVTERDRGEALRQSEARYRLMADGVPQIVWVTDASVRPAMSSPMPPTACRRSWPCR